MLSASLNKTFSFPSQIMTVYEFIVNFKIVPLLPQSLLQIAYWVISHSNQCLPTAVGLIFFQSIKNGRLLNKMCPCFSFIKNNMAYIHTFVMVLWLQGVGFFPQ